MGSSGKKHVAGLSWLAIILEELQMLSCGEPTDSGQLSLDSKSLHTPLTALQQQQIQQLSHKRLQRMPVQYVLGEWDFQDLTLKMRPPVFIPRPETEVLQVLLCVGSSLEKGSHVYDMFFSGCNRRVMTSAPSALVMA
ncbi:hypothetical protein DV515_00013117 [Chloebia gouldiae]|uniref:Release factor glutamine methyltransferase N-terminal domain-containing protein n=1 Tax=Chloebia gouldiae TaxID=44316 RepID=A0A3L8S2T7_CHLGU|nr:hypothetical protein DV515_00013117 [Chloebia gouldiae]